MDFQRDKTKPGPKENRTLLKSCRKKNIFEQAIVSDSGKEKVGSPGAGPGGMS